MADDTAPKSYASWQYTMSDFEQGTPPDQYSQVIADFRTQLKTEYPDKAGSVVIYDPTQGPEQLDALVEAACAGRNMSDEDKSTLRVGIIQTYDSLNGTFRERGEAKGFVAATTKFSIGGQEFSVIVPPPPDRLSPGYLRQTMAHEANHAVAMHHDEGAEAALGTVSAEMGRDEMQATLAEFSYRIACDPSPENIAAAQLAFETKNARMITENPEQTAANMVYYVPPDSFAQMVQDTLTYTAGGGKPSLAAANQIADRVTDRDFPSDEGWKQRQDEAVTLSTRYREEFPGDPQGFRASLQGQPGLAGSTFGSMERQEKFMQVLHPEAHDRVMSGEQAKAFDALEATQRPRSYSVTNRETEQGEYDLISVEGKIDGKDVLVGYSYQRDQAFVAVDTDNNKENGYEVYYRMTDDGTVMRGTDFYKMNEQVAEGNTAAATLTTNAGQLVNHTTFSARDHDGLLAVAEQLKASGVMNDQFSAANGATVNAASVAGAEREKSTGLGA